MTWCSGWDVPWVAPERSLAVPADVLGDAHAASWPALVIGPPPVADAQESARAADLSVGMAEVCAVRGVPFGDTTGLSGGPVWVREVATGDAYHPSASGYSRLTTLVEPVVDRWLAEQVAAPGPVARSRPPGPAGSQGAEG